MSTALTTTHTNGNGLPALPDWRACMGLAEKLATSSIIPVHLRGKPGDVLVILLTGEELGIGPMTALRTIHVLDGKPMMSADLMAAIALRSPECVLFQCVESTDKKAVYHAQRRGDTKPTVTTFTIEDAQRANLLGRDNWRKYQKAMLRARCCAAAARERFPDVLAGVYDQDEIGGGSTEPVRGEVREITPEPKRAAASKPQTLDDMVSEPEPEAASEAPAHDPDPFAGVASDMEADRIATEIINAIAAADAKTLDDLAKEHTQTVMNLPPQQRALVTAAGKMRREYLAAQAEQKKPAKAKRETSVPCSVEAGCKASAHDRACPSWIPANPAT